MPRLTLAQQIARLEDTAPAEFDPEDIYNADASGEREVGDDVNDDVEIKDPNAGREHYVEVGPSALRNAQNNIFDPKYDGVKTSRLKLYEQVKDQEALSEDAIEEEEARVSSEPPSRHGDSPPLPEDEEEEEEEEEEDHGLENEDKGQGNEPKHRKSAPTRRIEQEKAKVDALAAPLQKMRIADKQKGKAVAQQLRIWDNLVDARIRLQKTVMTANKLPRPNDIKSFAENPENSESLRKFLSEALQLSEDIFELKQTLLQKAGSSPPPRKKRRIELKIALESENVDFDSLIKESTEEMMQFETQTHLETLTTLQKWSAKVQAVAPAALLSSMKVSFKSGPGHFKSAGEMVDEALRDPEKLIKRTWNKSVRIGTSSPEKATEEAGNEEGDEETFDDKDFYQAMLRDVIESKGGKDAEVHVNPNRQKKSKKVDTRASKGRKLRYEPHEKLQNFMVPVPVQGVWHEEQIDELFSSLLGKGFGGQTNGVAQPGEPVVLHGLRIFG